MVSPRPELAGIVLAGGTAVRLGGVDKAGIEYAGTTLLERALSALAQAAEVVVVGAAVPTSRPVTFVREEPAYGGPAAGLLAGRDALSGHPEWLAVVAVDMPNVAPATFERLLEAAAGRDGALLVDPSGRRQLAGVIATARLDEVRPGDPHGLPFHRLVADLDLAEVGAAGDEAHDLDSWDDLRG
jgi:molybdopterin-guanine dinucleotide biosynthesis protein A